MKKTLLFISCFFLLGLSVELKKEDVQIKRSEDEIERNRKHFKTRKLTIDGDIDCSEITATDDVNCVNVIATDDVQGETFTYEAAVTGYLTVPYVAFKIETEGREYDYQNHDLRMGADSSQAYFYAPVYLPDEAIVTELILFSYRDDASAGNVVLDLMRETHYGIVTSTMATATHSTEGGWESPSDSTIVTATIDTETYQYFLRLTLDFNDAATDVRMGSARIKFTYTKP